MINILRYVCWASESRRWEARALLPAYAYVYEKKTPPASQPHGTGVVASVPASVRIFLLCRIGLLECRTARTWEGISEGGEGGRMHSKV